MTASDSENATFPVAKCVTMFVVTPPGQSAKIITLIANFV